MSKYWQTCYCICCKENHSPQSMSDDDRLCYDCYDYVKENDIDIEELEE